MDDVSVYIKAFSKKISRFSKEEQGRIMAAMDFASELHQNQKRASGEPYIIHPLAVAEILINLNLDAPTVIAAICHDVLEDTDVSSEQLKEKFGHEVEKLVDGVTKISIIKVKNKTIQNTETIRKMLFAMVQDIRVILIKLADKLHNMQTLQFLSKAKSRKIAEECLDIYAPLAGRLGISWIKDEIEDLALKRINPDIFIQIKRFIAIKKSERAEYLKRIKKAIYREARKEGIKIQIDMRAKHFYSVYQKMKKRGKNLDEVFDLLGVRILCNTTTECYTLLGLVHTLWKPISGRFKDYIAMPKANRYQSLHTTVMCYEGKLIEIQIRTFEMHRTAEFGIAAHWLYKSKNPRHKPDELPIINKLKNWNKARTESGDFLEEIKSELLKDTIYIFTPHGDVIELPKGATAIDFAYHIHTEIGHHCYAAKAGGRIIPLKKPLRNMQLVEIITSQKARPHVNWLRIVKTSRARSKIRHWLNKNDETLLVSRNVFVKKAEGVPPVKVKGKRKLELEMPARDKVGIRIGKERNIMIRIAGCCRPDRGDKIIGYISRGKGIMIHKENCPNLKFIKDYRQRSIDVEWEAMPSKTTR
jgi:guanosine-3',5'-bis(diphosphate) 3'-pyrophosphohydrolase